MWAYSHTNVGNNAGAGPSFHADFSRPLDSSSIRASSLSHSHHVRIHVNYLPFLATTSYELNSKLMVNRWPRFRALLVTDYLPQVEILVFLTRYSFP